MSRISYRPPVFPENDKFNKCQAWFTPEGGSSQGLAQECIEYGNSMQ